MTAIATTKPVLHEGFSTDRIANWCPPDTRVSAQDKFSDVVLTRDGWNELYNLASKLSQGELSHSTYARPTRAEFMNTPESRLIHSLLTNAFELMLSDPVRSANPKFWYD